MRYEISGSIRPIFERRPGQISQFDLREDWWPTFHHPEKRYECSEYTEKNKQFMRSEINDVKKENPIFSNLRSKTQKFVSKKLKIKVDPNKYLAFWGIVTCMVIILLFMN